MASEHLECPICLSPFSHACTTSCGHCFCGSCLLDYWQKQGKSQKLKCPIDRREVSMIIPNYVLRREVLHQLKESGETNVDAADIDSKIDEYNGFFANAPQPVTERLRDDLVVWNLMRSGGNTLYSLLTYASLVFATIYLFFPFDLIPDSYGLIGYMDDLALFAGAIWFIIYLVEVYKAKLLRQSRIHQ
eukprot:TRINITY_DN873_c0_g1_i1.p1 TRINITY_DN873_c0_g1~~TRINITY_DN873_c0_g1_i1.p1  ORF type:complete len:189 (+),score=7.26 TRINITY_DN873_c0_g1_i1:61-627(+)